MPDLPTPEPHGAVDVREVLGSIGRGFEENGDALALAAYCEWLGAAAGDRDEAAAAFARAAGALPRVDALDAGRESRRHWRPLDNAILRRLIAPLERRGLRALDLNHQDLLDCGLDVFANLTALARLNLAWCGRLRGSLEPLGGLRDLEVLDLSFCLDLAGTLEPLSRLTKLRSLSTRACSNLGGVLAPLKACPLRDLDVSQCLFSGRISALNADLLERLNVENADGIDGIGEYRSKRRGSVRIQGRSTRIGATSW